MPYTNPDGTAAYLIDGMNSGGMLIANSTEAITGDVYAQQLTFSGSGGVLTDCTISAGGSIIMGTSTTISGANQTIGIYDGGSMMLSSGATLRNFEVQSGGFVSGKGAAKVVSGTIYSGGSVKTSGNLLSATTVKSGAYFSAYTGLVISGVTIESGATFTYGGAVKWYGRTNNVASGAIAGRDYVYTDEDGTLYNYNGSGQATHFYNIILRNPTISATTYASAKTSAYDIEHKGGSFYVYASAVLYNYDNTVGKQNGILQTYHGSSATLSAAITLGGSETNIRQGSVRYWNTAISTYTADPNLYAENGVLYNLTLRAKDEGETYWLTRLNVQSGMTAYQPVISSGASLYIYSGASATGAQIYDKGALWLFTAGHADAPIVHEGGKLVISSASIDNLVIEGDETTGGYLVVSNGVRLDLGGSETTFAAGTIRYGHNASGALQYIDPTFRAEEGKLYGLTLKSSGNYSLKNFGIRDGISAVETVVSSGGTLRVSSGAVLLDPTLYVNGKTHVYAGGLVSGGVVSGGNGSTGAYQVLHISSGGSARGVTQSGGVIYVSQGGKITDAVIDSGRVYLFDAPAQTGQDDRPKISGADFEIHANGKVTFRGVNAYGSRIVVNEAGGFVGAQNGALVEDITLTNGAVTYVYTNPGTGCVDSGAAATIKDVKAIDGVVSVGLNGTADGIDMQAGVISCYDDNARVLNARISGGVVSMMKGTLADTTLGPDAELIVSGGAIISNLTVYGNAHVTMVYNGTAGIDTAIFDTLENVSSLSVDGVEAGNTYVLTAADAATTVINCESGLYDNAVAKGVSYTNGIAGVTYSFDGTALAVADTVIGTAAAAAKLADGATAINNGDLAAKWDANTTYSTNVYLADGMTTGDAWLNIDGFAADNANVYGAAKDQNFTGAVNIGAASGKIKNLAAGAALGGSVAGVKLTVGDGMNVTGAVYAGGMGNVADEVETLIEGGSFAGNVFAGAFCNYAANGIATATDDIELTVEGGSFAGNIYAGAAVKAGAATGVVHTAGDIELELNGGKATKGTFCVYGGGYATGTVEAAAVYEADDVTITIAGGEWGAYASGRGIFGGVYADKVAATVDSVDITVTGGTMGNVYGGGWAQNGGTSTVVGEVNITIAGDAEIANVFGGGSYSSTSGGSTQVGSVTIRVEGGNVKNNIFAAGQNEHSTVTGDVSVTFKGGNDYTCNVYGYGTPSSSTAGGDKTLAFAGYTGTLSGKIGGFDRIEFTGDAEATFTQAFDGIDNEAWTFDVAERDTSLAGTAMLEWSNADFTGDTITLNLASGNTAEWDLIKTDDGTAVYNKFDVRVDGVSILPETIDIYDKIADGAYAGWGFTDDGGTLKFKNLA